LRFEGEEEDLGDSDKEHVVVAGEGDAVEREDEGQGERDEERHEEGK